MGNFNSNILKRHIFNITFFICMLILLLPKLVLVSFFSDRWVEASTLDVLSYLHQDIVLVLILSVLYLYVFNLKENIWHILFSTILNLSILIILLIDLRVRELWLAPLNTSLVTYAIDNFNYLLSGSKIFFNHSAGFGYTFRYLIFVLLLVHTISWLVILLCKSDNKNYGHRIKQSHKQRSKAIIIGIVCTLIFAVFYNSFRSAKYQLDKNILIEPIISFTHSLFLYGVSKKDIATDIDFEQPVAPLVVHKENVVINGEKVPDFDNLIIIILESFRADYGLNSKEAPTLTKLSNEGLAFKSYVSIPHSSKGYHSILTGRHPYPSIEIKEAMYLRQPSIIRELVHDNNMKAVSFTSMNLSLENTIGFLKSIGVTNNYYLGDLVPSAIKANSFGQSDQYLFSSSIPILETIQKDNKGLLALYFPHAAHYPYNLCRDYVSDIDDFEKYKGCIAVTDELINDFISSLDNIGILDSTLLVLVGDHGESFGEHGLFVHNSSMYDEELTVPLIFWASEQRMKSSQIDLSHQVDIVPTLADIFSITNPEIRVQGRSLLRPRKEKVFFSTSFFEDTVSAIVIPPNKYIFDHGSKSLIKFDLTTDPDEKSPITVKGNDYTQIVKRINNYIYYQRKVFN